MLRRPVIWIVVVAVFAVGGVFGLYWFQPWKLVTDKEVSETLAAVETTPPAAAPAATGSAAPKAPTVVRQGTFITHEHETTGTARIIRNADGSHRLELVDLDTSNGPDLRVWLTDQPVKKGTAGWRVFDDGTWLELGRLKGNKGDQAYAIPADTDLDRLHSVSIWCKRFSVSFGAAALS
ncbi:DM13 domain-containing protein [Phytohabitans sp. LJ34]|uniref:DM13 domain-containing protein n=1 Tax=Phytohabitans sp. LJ34 TaxID=3452217 RepID=UPI003F8BB9B1